MPSITKIGAPNRYLTAGGGGRNRNAGASAGASALPKGKSAGLPHLQYKSFAGLSKVLAGLRVQDVILDGEIVCLDRDGRSQ